MPRLSDAARVTRQFDRRIKLTEQDHQEIIRLHSEGLLTREISRIYSVDRATIKGILNPQWKLERAEQNKVRQAQYRERLKVDGFYREKRNKNMRDHRAYKKALYEQGLITINKKEEGEI